MTRDQLQVALADLGWITLIHRALGGKPTASFALYQLMQAAGRPLTYETLAAGYAAFEQGGGAIGPSHRGRQLSGSPAGVQKSIERLRAALADFGIVGVVHRIPTSSPWGGAYLIEKRDVSRIEAALLYACGIEIDEPTLRAAA